VLIIEFLQFSLSTTMPGYEDSVYLAKLAEQAERYEGQSMPASLVLNL